MVGSHQARSPDPMGPENLESVGIAGILVVLVLREVFSFLKSREAVVSIEEDPSSNAHSRIEEAVAALASTSAQMATILCRTDDTGAPMVYVPRSLSKAIEDLAKNIERLTDKVDRI